ncbi:MAG: hypothetical protein WCA16_09135 [Candidatus Sulfotelmatobacter sp.]
MAWQFGQAQFHWGNPPPAAEPRIFTRILRVYNLEWKRALPSQEPGRELGRV